MRMGALTCFLLPDKSMAVKSLQTTRATQAKRFMYCSIEYPLPRRYRLRRARGSLARFVKDPDLRRIFKRFYKEAPLWKSSLTKHFENLAGREDGGDKT